MTKIVRSKPKFGVSVKEDDGLYSVIRDGQVVYSTRVLAAAEAVYGDILDEMTEDARRVRAREQAHYTLQAVRSDSFERRTATSRKKGGRGGRGGV